MSTCCQLLEFLTGMRVASRSICWHVSLSDIHTLKADMTISIERRVSSEPVAASPWFPAVGEARKYSNHKISSGNAQKVAGFKPP